MTSGSSASHAPVASLPSRRGAGLLLPALWTIRRSGRNPLQPKTIRFAVPPFDPAHVHTYRDALGFAQSGVPLTYLYLFAQRSHLAVMLDRHFPYAVPGIVHVANELRWLTNRTEVLQPGRASVLEVRVEPEPPSATGAHFITLHATHIQDEQPLALCSSRYLAKRGQQSGSGRLRGEAGPAALPQEWARYLLPRDAGHAYARLSGDANPIHLWSWSARLLGFRQPIIHGMHTLGRVAAELERVRGARLRHLAARFLRPIPIPGEVVVLGHDRHAQAWSGGELALDAEAEFEVAQEDTGRPT